VTKTIVYGRFSLVGSLEFVLGAVLGSARVLG
jgi:hypothetical protein